MTSTSFENATTAIEKEPTPTPPTNSTSSPVEHDLDKAAGIAMGESPSPGRTIDYNHTKKERRNNKRTNHSAKLGTSLPSDSFLRADVDSSTTEDEEDEGEEEQEEVEEEEGRGDSDSALASEEEEEEVVNEEEATTETSLTASTKRRVWRRSLPSSLILRAKGKRQNHKEKKKERKKEKQQQRNKNKSKQASPSSPSTAALPPPAITIGGEREGYEGAGGGTTVTPRSPRNSAPASLPSPSAKAREKSPRSSSKRAKSPRAPSPQAQEKTKKEKGTKHSNKQQNGWTTMSQNEGPQPPKATADQKHKHHNHNGNNQNDVQQHLHLLLGIRKDSTTSITSFDGTTSEWESELSDCDEDFFLYTPKGTLGASSGAQLIAQQSNSRKNTSSAPSLQPSVEQLFDKSASPPSSSSTSRPAAKSFQDRKTVTKQCRAEHGDGYTRFTCTIEDRPQGWRIGDVVTIQVDVDERAGKKVKSMRVHIEEKHRHPPHQNLKSSSSSSSFSSSSSSSSSLVTKTKAKEFDEGFPLAAYTDHSFTKMYTIPENQGLHASSNNNKKVQHELVVAFTLPKSIMQNVVTWVSFPLKIVFS